MILLKPFVGNLLHNFFDAKLDSNKSSLSDSYDFFSLLLRNKYSLFFLFFFPSIHSFHDFIYHCLQSCIRISSSPSAVIVGVLNWQRRLWTVVGDYVMASRGPLAPFKDPDPLATDVRFQREHRRCTEAVSTITSSGFIIGM